MAWIVDSQGKVPGPSLSGQSPSLTDVKNKQKACALRCRLKRTAGAKASAATLV